MLGLRVCALVGLLCMGACRPTSGAAPTPDVTVVEPATTGDAIPEDSPIPGCPAGAWTWDGRPQSCPYEVAGCCHRTPESACRQACSPREQCHVLESYPAQVACDRD